MRLSTLSALALGAAGASAQMLNATYIQAVIAALSAANLTSLADAAQAAANSTEGAAFLANLGGSNKTLFAPNNAAFAGVDPSVAADPSLLANILSYHVVNASILPSGISTSPNHTIARTLYNNAMLPGNRSQPVVLTRMDNTTMVIQSSSNATVLAGPVVAANFHIYVIDEVLSLPPTLTEVATEFVPSLAGLITQAGLLDTLEMVTGLTVFAPSNDAISGVAEALGTLNSTAVQTILSNHVIAGAVVYSTSLASGNYTSLGGEAFRFMSNTTGTYVMSGNSTARIIRSDVITQNGVVHVIDSVLVNAATNPGAAASASSSYAAAATVTSQEVGVIGTAAATITTTGSAAATARSSGAALSNIKGGSVAPIFVSIAAVFSGVLVGASML